jgi:hypothetical protein
MIDASAMPPRHAGEGRYLRLLFVAATKAVDTGIRRHDDVCGAGGSILRIPGIILGAEKIDPSVRSPWRGVEVATVPGLGLNGVRSFLPSVIDRSATHFEPWEPPGAEAEAGLIAAQQRGGTVRSDAIGVGEDAVNAD